jgi:hypothetical protein
MTKKVAVILVVLIVSMMVMTFEQQPVAKISNPTEATENNSKVSSTVNASILVDESHCATDTALWTPGNASRFGSLLMDYGYKMVMDFNTSLDSGILGSYDILMLFFPQVELTAGEISAVNDFVDNGGNLLLVGVDHRPTISNYTAQPLNAISQTYGITFNDNSVYGRAQRSAGEITDHAVTYSVDSILSWAGNFLQSCTLTVTSPATSLITVKGGSFLAVAEVGSAKIVAVGGAGPFLDYSYDSLLTSQDDPEQLSLNIVDWMAGNSQRTVVVPDEYVLTVGNGPTLSEPDLDGYQMFVGLYHDHTTYSDGRSTAAQMVLAGLNAQLDFMVMTDHSWETPSAVGIDGAIACKAIVDAYGQDTLIVVGAELSNGPHIVGFPLTQNIWISNSHDRVEAIHSQGGIAVFAHPLLGEGYIEPWTNYDYNGYDAFEVVNDIFSYGEGETAYFKPFLAASDGHDAAFVGQTLNAIFVKNPSGPNGTLSQNDIVDAVLNRRVVGLCKPIGVIVGEKVWVDRYLEIRDEANTAIQNAEDTINQAKNAGASASLSEAYLQTAKTALYYQNPIRAIALCSMATSEYMLGIDVSVVADGIGVVEPQQSAQLSLTLTNNLDVPVSLNATPYQQSGVTLDQTSAILQAGANSDTTEDFTGTASSEGYARILFTLKDYNSPEYIHPIFLAVGGFVANVTAEATQTQGGYNFTIQVPVNLGDARYIRSIQVDYNDGSSSSSANMTLNIDKYSVTLGPFAGGTNLTYTVTVNDILGNSFVVEHSSYLFGGEGLQIDPMVLVIGVGAAIAIIALVVVVMKLRK